MVLPLPKREKGRRNSLWQSAKGRGEEDSNGQRREIVFPSCFQSPGAFSTALALISYLTFAPQMPLVVPRRVSISSLPSSSFFSLPSYSSQTDIRIESAAFGRVMFSLCRASVSLTTSPPPASLLPLLVLLLLRSHFRSISTL